MNDQLVSYIKQQLAKNEPGEVVVKELLDVGWKKEIIDEAFAVAKPTAPDTHSITTSENTSVQEQSVNTFSAQKENLSDTYATTPKDKESTSTESLAEISNAKLPSISAMIKGGFDIYKEQFKTLISIGAIRYGLALIVSVAMVVGGMSLAGVFLSGSGTETAIPVATLFVIGVCVAWLNYWLMLANLKAIQGHKEKVSFKVSFNKTGSQVWSFLWISLSALLAIVGGTFLLIAGASLIISPFLLLAHTVTIIIAVTDIVLLIVSLYVFSVWFAFSIWVFLTDNLRGISALTASRDLVRGRVWKISTRLYGALFVIGIAGSSLIYLLKLTIGSFVPMGATIISLALSLMFISPLSFATIYFLYEKIRLQKPVIPETPHKTRTVFILYVVVGAIVGSTIIGASFFVPSIIASLL